MMPLPPPLLSTSTGWPHICVSLSAITRMVTSVEAPGGNGTTSVTRLEGKLSARAIDGAARAAPIPASAPRRPILFVIVSLPFDGAEYVGSFPCMPSASLVLCADRPRKNGPSGVTPRDRSDSPAPWSTVEGRLGHDRPALPLHADQLRRQGRGRAGRAADHEGIAPRSQAVRPDRLVVLLPVRRLG